MTVVSAASAPQTFVIPNVHGDPGAARRLAASYRAAADEVDTAARTAFYVVDDLAGAWRGRGQLASGHPMEVVHRNMVVTARALQETADGLDAYAHKLSAAHEHHWFSLHKLLAVATVVTVTAAAVVVTMGAAAVAEVALAATAAGEATAAAGAASLAGEGAAAGLAESTASLAGVRTLVAFAAPHVVQAELSAGFAAGLEEADAGRLDWHEIGVSAAAGLAGSAGAAQAGRAAEALQLAERTAPWVRVLLPHLGQAVTWAGVDAGADFVDGQGVSLRELLFAGGLAGVGSAMSAARPTGPLHVAAYNARQSLDDLLKGRVDLDLHEGPGLGHTLVKHVNVTDADLWHRIITENRREASRFVNVDGARSAISQAIRKRPEEIADFFFGSDRQLRVRVSLDRVVGFVMSADGTSTPTRQLVVWLRRDAVGPYISSAYPELPR